MMFKYTEADFGKYTVSNDDGVRVVVFTETSAIVLTELLNKWCKKMEYQDRVIRKCIRNEKKYKAVIEDNEELLDSLNAEITVLNKEKRILKKIIHELN